MDPATTDLAPTVAPRVVRPRAAVPPPVEVVSVPAGHPYVRHTQALPGSESRVRVHPDPDPDDPSQVAGDRWWPPVALDPTWVRGRRFDVLHLHFGYDERTPEQLAELCDALDADRKPLVLTVHDLRNPHHEDAHVLDAQLDVLVPRAAAVVTLTARAAAEVAERWGVVATVLPHPHVVDLDAMPRVRAARRAAGPVAPVVGVAVKDLRLNTDPLRLLPTLARVVSEHPGARLRVTVHHTLHDRWDERATSLVDWLDSWGGEEIEVVWHDRLTDEQLWAELASQHVAVLPYRFGTHSGWLEACHDVGTRVLAPSHGCYADQGADATYPADEDGIDAEGLAEALRTLLAQPTDELVGLECDARAAQRTHVADTLHALYTTVLR